MSKFLRENIFNILIFLLLSIQAFMYFYDNRPSPKVFSQKSMSVENFSSIVLSKSGLTKIGSEKLNKIDEDNFFLQGKSYLENNLYKIYGEDISINLNEDISNSKYISYIWNVDPNRDSNNSVKFFWVQQDIGAQNALKQQLLKRINDVATLVTTKQYNTLTSIGANV